MLDRKPEETYITPAMDAAAVTCVGWEGEIPKKTWVNCQIRTADTLEDLEQAPFVGSDGTENTRLEKDQQLPACKGKLMQVKLFLGAVNSGSSPRITEIYGR